MQVLLSQRRKTQRAPANPLDKCTIVSIYPKFIREIKPTIQPGVFEIPAGSYEVPGILVVGPSSWWREIDEEMPLLEIPNSSIQVADSVVRDYCNGLFAYNPDDKSPGIFYLPGEVSLVNVKKDHKDKLDAAAAKQKNWYFELVKQADILWARTNQNPIAISDDMRMAAQALSMKDKPWIKDYNTITLINCVACGALRNPLFPICQACHTVVDKALYDKLNLTGEAKK